MFYKLITNNIKKPNKILWANNQRQKKKKKRKKLRKRKKLFATPWLKKETRE